MSKANLFVKYIKYISYFINSLLEKNLNKLNLKNFSNLFKNNKIILTFVAVFVIFITYLLVPTFYHHSDISRNLNIKLKNKLNLNFKFSQNIKYSFFPRPHFIILDSAIIDNQSEISKINRLKIYLSFNNLFSLQKIKIRDLIFENANFNFDDQNYNFFVNLLDKNFQNGNLIIKNSNIFFRTSENEVLFINKILKMRYYYDLKELKNIVNADNKIFNIPYSMKTFFNEDKSKIFSKLNLSLIKLQIENELSLDDEKKFGKLELSSNKLKRIAEYQIYNDYFNFHFFDKKDQPSISYKGRFNLKPFYANLEGNLDEINLSYLFGSNAIISQFLKTEIFNNKNINFKLKINADNIYNNNNFRNINLNSKIHNGLIDTDKTRFEWRNFADFELLETLIFVRDGELVLDGKLKININNYDEIYKFLLTPKKFRNKINQVDLNFTYNFDKKTAELKDIKIDNKINKNLNNALSNVILKKEKLQNKIYFKNLLNEAIKSYAG